MKTKVHERWRRSSSLIKFNINSQRASSIRWQMVAPVARAMRLLSVLRSRRIAEMPACRETDSMGEEGAEAASDCLVCLLAGPDDVLMRGPSLSHAVHAR
jgi:hypothetical protein